MPALLGNRLLAIGLSSTGEPVTVAHRVSNSSATRVASSGVDLLPIGQALDVEETQKRWTREGINLFY